MSRDRKDHHVPQCFLRGFCNPNRVLDQRPLWVFDIESRRWSQKSTSGIGWRRGFYDYSKDAQAELGVSTADGVFASLESQYSKVLLDLRRQHFENWQDHLDFLLNFGQMLRARSVLFIAQQMEQVERSILGVVESISEDRRTLRYRSPTAEDIAPEKLRNKALTRMRDEIAKGADWMSQLSWALRLTKSVLDPFITSECPVSLIGQRTSASDAFFDAESLIQIPLSWEACIIGRRAEIRPEERVSYLSATQLMQYRAQCMRHAESFVVSPTNLI